MYFSVSLKKDQTIILPKSDLGKAIDYCLKREKSLVTYLEDGRLEFDNNLSLCPTIYYPQLLHTYPVFA